MFCLCLLLFLHLSSCKDADISRLAPHRRRELFQKITRRVTTFWQTYTLAVFLLRENDTISALHQDSEPQKLELTGPDGDRDRWRSLALSIINEWFRRAGQRPGQPVDGTQLFQALVEMDQASLASSLADDLLAW